MISFFPFLMLRVLVPLFYILLSVFSWWVHLIPVPLSSLDKESIRMGSFLVCKEPIQKSGTEDFKIEMGKLHFNFIGIDRLE